MYPFMTVDDSLHLSSQRLKEFSNYSGTDNIHYAVYGRNQFVKSIKGDETTVRSLAHGYERNDDIIGFGLSW